MAAKKRTRRSRGSRRSRSGRHGNAVPNASPLSGPRKAARDRAIHAAAANAREFDVDYGVWMDKRGEFHVCMASEAPWRATIAVAHAPRGSLSYKRYGHS